MSSDNYVAMASLRAQLQLAYEAIDATRKALEAVHAGVIGGEELDAAIYRAVDLLPDAMRGNLPSGEKKARRRRSDHEIEDLLG